MAFLKISALLLTTLVAICSADFNATLLTKPRELSDAEIYKTKGLDCKILKVDRDFVLEAQQWNASVQYNTTGNFERTVDINIHRVHFPITLINNNRSTESSFYLNATNKNAGFYFSLGSNYLQVNSFDGKNHETKKFDILDLLPFNVSTNFDLYFVLNNVSLWSGTKEVYNKTLYYTSGRPKYEITFSNHSAGTVFTYYVPVNSTVYADKFEVYCKNLTQNHHNTTNNLTNFIALIDLQHELDETMQNDLSKFLGLNLTNSDVDYLQKVENEVESNYLLSKQLHGQILLKSPLKSFEIAAKNQYLEEEVFHHIRTNYFTLTRVILQQIEKLMKNQ